MVGGLVLRRSKTVSVHAESCVICVLEVDQLRNNSLVFPSSVHERQEFSSQLVDFTHVLYPDSVLSILDVVFFAFQKNKMTFGKNACTSCN